MFFHLFLFLQFFSFSSSACSALQFRDSLVGSVIHHTVPAAPQVIDLAASSRVCGNATLRFLVVGDWGGTAGRGANMRYPHTTSTQLKVADALAEQARLRRPQFVLGLGDNFYQEGVRTVDDERFDFTFENVYYHKELQLPWLMMAGNHGTLKCEPNVDSAASSQTIWAMLVLK